VRGDIISDEAELALAEGLALPEEEVARFAAIVLRLRAALNGEAELIAAAPAAQRLV
jgi:hypothetical protein